MRHTLKRNARIPRFPRLASRCIGVGAFSYLATDALLSFLDAPKNAGQTLSFLLLYALIAWQMWQLWNERLWEKPHRRTTAAALVLALGIGACATVGRQLHETDQLIYALQQAAYIAGLASVLFVMLWRFLHWTTTRNATEQTDAPAPPPRPVLFWLLLLGLLLCRLPAFLALFPGVLSNDSVWQMNQALGLVPFDDWHPAIHTWLIAACTTAGQFLGVPVASTPAVYSLVQTLFLSAVCAHATVSLLRMKVRPLFAGLAYAFFALYPIHAVYGVSMWKDVPHAGVTLLLVTCLLRWARDPKGFFHSRARVAITALLLFLFSTLRHNAMYAYLFFIPFFVWHLRAYWKRALLLCLAVCAMIGAYRGGLSLLKVIPSRSVEVLSVPLQLTARIAHIGQDGLLTEEEKSILREILPIEELPRLYDPRTSDPVKWVFNEDVFKKNPVRYIALFARLMRAHPGVLLESFLLGNYGYWYPGTIGYWIAFYSIYPNSLGISRHGVFFEAEDLHQYEMTLRNSPVISQFFSIGFMVWTLALAAAVCWVNRRGAWPSFALLLGLWLTLLLSPVFAEYRYAYGLVLCAPVCLCTMVGGGSTWTRSRY